VGSDKVVPLDDLFISASLGETTDDTMNHQGASPADKTEEFMHRQHSVSAASSNYGPQFTMLRPIPTSTATNSGSARDEDDTSKEHALYVNAVKWSIWQSHRSGMPSMGWTGSGVAFIRRSLSSIGIDSHRLSWFNPALFTNHVLSST
jgi:hypothetical protein